MTIIPELDLAFYVVANRNGEGGGPRVKIGRPVMTAIMQTFIPDRVAKPIDVPDAPADLDLSEYAGDYYWSVFCHSCTSEEYELGAWPRPEAIRVEEQPGRLIVDGRVFLPLGNDIFVDQTGYDEIYFKRDSLGTIQSYSFKENPTTYERG